MKFLSTHRLSPCVGGDVVNGLSGLKNPILLPCSGLSVLAGGAWLKNTICVTQGDQAQVSELIGDLDSIEARLMLVDTVELMCAQLPVAMVAHDLHPDFYSTQLALSFAEKRGLPTLAVQHHHAHIAAICAEHGYTEPVLGLALDGVGLGTDGTAWGGELLLVDGAEFWRLGHLAHMLMPGGDRAAKEPWRMAAAVLHQLGRGDEIAQRFPNQSGAATVAAMLERRLNCPVTSSMGRLFDAAAGLLGVCEIQNFEAEAAIALQKLAQRQIKPMEEGWRIDENGVLDFSPLLEKLADCTDAACGAALFHATVSAGLAVWVQRAAGELRHVALGGGCFYNEILLRSLSAELAAQGLQVLTSKQPGDSSISLGQAWVALQFMNKGI
ncbi:MAG: carbamoyltransferase HypF [Gallionella sp.]|nr:carbamoyltransferase HypF [Gallionella sp.]